MVNTKTLTSNLIKFAAAFAASFIFAAACYDILLFFGINPFAGIYRMYYYHWIHPYQFIAIPCFVFSVLAVIFSKRFAKQTLIKQILMTLLIVFLTILISSPLGGMLWHLHDMLAGYFPAKWLWKLIRYGFREGIQMGWLIILFSVPYNIIGLITSFFIIKTISVFSVAKEQSQEEK